MAMTPEELDRLEKLAEAATPGPWEVEWDDYNDGDGPFPQCIHPAGKPLERLVETDSGVYGPRANDARFIAEARTAVPELLAALREARAAHVQCAQDRVEMRQEVKRLTRERDEWKAKAEGSR